MGVHRRTSSDTDAEFLNSRLATQFVEMAVSQMSSFNSCQIPDGSRKCLALPAALLLFMLVTRACPVVST